MNREDVIVVDMKLLVAIIIIIIIIIIRIVYEVHNEKLANMTCP